MPHYEILQYFLWLQELSVWLNDLVTQYGYLGMFIISFLGALSILIPIPYTVLIFVFGKILNPILLAISAGSGAALGEFIGYLLGYYGRTVLSETRKKKMEYLLKIFSRYGAVTIFIFALTPLPDDLLFIPLGIMHYSFIKAFIPCILGKILMSLIVAYGGKLSIEFIERIFGEGGGWLTSIITAVLLTIIIVIMLKVDWEKYFQQKLERSSIQNKRSKDEK